MYRMAWTDERMDDFAKHTDQRFDAVDRRFDEVDRRLDKLEKRVESGFDKVDRRFEQIDRRFEGIHQMMHRTMVQVGGGLLVTMAIGFTGVIVTHL
jgi:tetrahydromethanopterin S-methyltransferase subunit G